ncbi:TorD/DmsD family molecular chaperone [Halarcobacter sp.]|uniref:TorD/DmsD family molecular chaperone n=1 Tax=Halarcobacter sp. TaxID=2321133 RepID=UPI003A92A593
MHSKEIDKARQFIYNVLAMIFLEDQVKDNQAQILESLKLLSENPFDTDFAESVNSIIKELESYEKDEFYVQYQQLFLVPFGNSVSLSASWHYDEREAGLMLLKVRDILGKTKIRKDEKAFTAPEDNFGFIFTLCAYLIEQQVEGEIKENLQKELFKEVINPFVEKFSFQLVSSGSDVYSHVGSLLNIFFNFERSYLEIEKVT